MTAVAGEFDVQGKRVTVVGAARSGIAAAELLARRRAQVTLTEMRPDVADAEPLRRLGVQLELGGHRGETLTDADLIVLSPGVPPDLPVIQKARERGVVIGELELASRWLSGRVVAITGTKEVHHDGVDGPDSRGRRLPRDGRRQYRRPAQRRCRRRRRIRSTSSRPAASSWSRSRRSTRDCGDAELSPDHLDRHPDIESYGAAKAGFSKTRRQTTGPSSTRTIRLGWASPEGAPGGTAVRRTAPIERGTAVEDGWIVDRRADRPAPPVRLVPLDAIHLLGPHLVSDVMAAATVGAIGRRAGAADRRGRVVSRSRAR